MAHRNGDRGFDTHLNHILDEIQNGSLTSRVEQLKNLKAIFDRTHKAKGLDMLTDKSYHKIYEVVFKIALEEKAKVFTTKKGAKQGVIPAASMARIAACADAFRTVVKAGVSKLKAKTVEAIVDHITQTLPKADGEYFRPLAQDYLRALCSLFEHQANVERLKPITWSETVTFCLQGINQYVDDNEAEPSGLARSFSGLGASHASGSLAKSSMGNGHSQSRSSSVSRQNVEDLLNTLLSLVSAPNAPLLEKASEIVEGVFRLLRSQGSAVSAVYQLTFSILNTVLSFCREDRSSLLQEVGQKAVPIICRFWQGKTSAKDEMLNSVRDEMLIILFTVQLHLERSLMDDATTDLLSSLTGLVDVMRAEYVRRSDRDQLQLEDLDITDLGSTASDVTPFRLAIFRLRPHNIRTERNWANLQIIGLLEKLVSIGEQKRLAITAIEDDSDKHPRKRQRIGPSSDRLLDPIKDENESTRLAGLQILPFVLHSCHLPALVLDELLAQLSVCASDKRGHIASWALLAIASCADQKASAENNLTDWVQLWHTGARALTFSATCRAAAAQLHATLAASLVQYHEVGESVDAMIIAADVNGPVVLCDSSIFLMMHILHTRVTEVPGASLVACQHVTRWLFAQWNPADRSLAALSSPQIRPHHVVDLLRTTLGLERLPMPPTNSVVCGPVAQAWQQHLFTQGVVRYLLLLDDLVGGMSLGACSGCPKYPKNETLLYALENAHFQSTQKLILELLSPKASDLLESWKSHTVDRSSVISIDTFRRALDACVTLLLLVSHFTQSTLPQFHRFEGNLDALSNKLVDFVLGTGFKDLKGSQLLVETLLQIVRPYLPACGSECFDGLSKKSPHLLQFFTIIATGLDRRRTPPSPELDDDTMDLDEDFPIQNSQVGVDGQTNRIPRRDIAVEMDAGAFLIVTKARLALIKAMSESLQLKGSMPPAFITYLLDLNEDELLLCRQLVQEMLQSDLMVEGEDAARLVEHFGVLLASDEWSRCEIMHCICLDVLIGLGPLWTQIDGSDLAENGAQVYKWFIEICLKENMASPTVQKRISKLLLLLLHVDSENKISASNKIPSANNSLLNIVKLGNTSVKFYIGNHLPEYFEIFILKDHDQIFVDVMNSLPANSDWIEGIAFRLFVFARLASKWPTLLRRCIYHIFEIPAKLPDATRHATKCLLDVSFALAVNGPQELFVLFAPQILYTWLDDEKIRDLPFQIFGFASLKDLVRHSQQVAMGLMAMRGQGEAIRDLAELLGLTEVELVRKCFANATAYSIAYRSSDKSKTRVFGEALVKKCLGSDMFFESINLHFVEIIALFFNLIDHQEMEKYLEKSDDLIYAAKALKEMKSINSSSIDLPPNQQPTFRARLLPYWIQHLCDRTEMQPAHMYTPALVVSIARTLLNTIHPALGSLHACSVLRKLRVLVSMAGKSAVQGYPLEMILQSVSAFIADTECVEDALGIIQYLLIQGASHLEESPTFVAGITLSILGSLRVFLQSSASTTLDTQHAITMSKAETFHGWMKTHIANYDASMMRGPAKTRFQSLVKSACEIGLVGTAQVGTHESDLLSSLFEDEQAGESVLSQPSRELALTMLCSEFKNPSSFRTDILGSHELSISNAGVVWKSCKGDSVSKKYLAWAGRVLGRAFAASGHIHEDLLRESSLSQIKQLSKSPDEESEDNSQACLLTLLQALTLGQDRQTLGLAEVALRLVVTDADEALLETCRQNLSLHLIEASSWPPYPTPPSETDIGGHNIESISDPFTADAIARQTWLRDLTVILARYVPDDPLLRSLIPILRGVPGFADQAFPFILHLVLSMPSVSQQTAKKTCSNSFREWFKNSDTVDKTNLKTLINAILYLRTQPLMHEKSTADRSRWLDIDYANSAAAATQCGMFKIALLFIEEHGNSQISAKSSRRSSALNQDIHEPPTEMLLTIFQNIDDPDLFYGVRQTPSLSNITARLEYEKDGPKSLAFRGAQYDSHIITKDPQSAHDAQSLVKALDVHSLSGLSHSLLQAQQMVGMSTSSLETMFRNARKLEQWDIPVPSNCSNDAVTIYKAFQALQNASDYPAMLQTINEGFDSTMSSLIRNDLSANALHSALQTLAALAELDEVVSTSGSVEFEDVLSRFKNRSGWMKTGRFDDINQVLSCRGTILSTLSRQPRLQTIVGVGRMDARLVEVQTALLAADLYRSHNALQESLSLAFILTRLIKPCEDVGLNLEIAVQVEAASAMWDQGEMASSIGMLQALDDATSLKKQTAHISVGRADLLSKIGSQVSIARLEKPEEILENYLKPALKELKGKSKGSEAGQVFHQFAVFCDQQLQDTDGLEDLERLKKLSKNKQDEVDYLGKMITSGHSKDKERTKQNLSKQKTWLRLDEEELQRHLLSREEFLRQCLGNHLLALAASDDHDTTALRFSALWLEHSEQRMANEAVGKHLDQVPSRKFAPLVNQLTSRLQDNTTHFQQLLLTLVVRICQDHPYHAMYQIYAGAASPVNKSDDIAVLRRAANAKVAKRFSTLPAANLTWQFITAINNGYCQLAKEKEWKEGPYKSGKRIAIRDSPAANHFNGLLVKYRIPPPTMQIPLAADCDYSKLPKMLKFEPTMSIASGVSTPKIITAIATDGRKYRQLVKGSNDDLRQDAIMEQVFEQVSELLKTNQSTRQRNLSIRTYKVLPLTNTAGVIEFVPNTLPLHEYLMPAHEKYYPKELKGSQCRKEIGDVQNHPVIERIKKFRWVTDRFHPVMRYFFTERFTDPDEWFVKRLAYTRSTAAISILGHVLGLGDRHGHNILLDARSGEVVHIDLGVAFEGGRVLPVPELVPFRLTRDIVDGMGITKTEGVFRRCCEFTLEALRKEAYSIMTILDVLRYDPLYLWSVSPVRLAKLQEGQSAAAEGGPTKDVVNEPGEADRALTVVNKKLSKTLSVAATVHDLINQAQDEKNLAVLYSGWAAYA